MRVRAGTTFTTLGEDLKGVVGDATMTGSREREKVWACRRTGQIIDFTYPRYQSLASWSLPVPDYSRVVVTGSLGTYCGAERYSCLSREGSGLVKRSKHH